MNGAAIRLSIALGVPLLITTWVAFTHSYVTPPATKLSEEEARELTPDRVDLDQLREGLEEAQGRLKEWADRKPGFQFMNVKDGAFKGPSSPLAHWRFAVYNPKHPKAKSFREKGLRQLASHSIRGRRPAVLAMARRTLGESPEHAELRKRIDEALVQRIDEAGALDVGKADLRLRAGMEPGELAHAWATSPPEDSETAKRFVEYYRRWWRESDNQRLRVIPGHIQAAILRVAAGQPGYERDERWAFAMADWAVARQIATDDGPHAGGFHPTNKDELWAAAIGTAEVVIALVEAWRLAEGAGDKVRSDRYANSIQRACANLLRNQVGSGEGALRAVGAIRQGSGSNSAHFEALVSAVYAFEQVIEAGVLESIANK